METSYNGLKYVSMNLLMNTYRIANFDNLWQTLTNFKRESDTYGGKIPFVSPEYRSL